MANFISNLIKNHILKKIKFRITRIKNSFFKIKRKSKIIDYDFFLKRVYLLRKRILLFRFRIKYGKLYITHKKICWINTPNINYILKVNKDKYYYYLRILKGDWDKNISDFKSSLFHKAFNQRFNESKNWEDTIYYQTLLNMINNGIIIARAKNKEELDKTFRFYDLLYNNIKKNFYISFFDSKFSKKLIDFWEIVNNISVYIDRYGRFLIIDGRHRVSIAKILNIPKIPAIIIARHEAWINFRRNLLYFFKKYQRGKLYQPLMHPDLLDLPFNYSGLSFDTIMKNISSSQGKLLDIRANLGYFCHKFEDEGFDCYAVEPNPMHVYFMKKLKKAENKQFKIIPQSIFEYSKGKDLVFDVVLALNGFNEYLKNEQARINLINFLKSLRIKELFLGISKPRGIKRNYSIDQSLNLVIENSCLNEVKLIERLKDGRYIYIFTAN